MTKDAPGMRGPRSPNQNGQLRDTRMGTIKKSTTVTSMLPRQQLGNFLKDKGIASLNELIRNSAKKGYLRDCRFHSDTNTTGRENVKMSTFNIN